MKGKGQAYKEVMERLRAEGRGGAATVWFGDEPVFGFANDDGTWLHPSDECGRDEVPMPGAGCRHHMWNSVVESRSTKFAPTEGGKYKCWCCHWLREVKRQHAQGAVICCAVSNIFTPEWVSKYSAGSSELSDAQADKFGLQKERFKNCPDGLPPGWGEGEITISDGSKFARKAPIHERTKLPLGQGCRWERSVLDKLDFPVFAFFMP
ncbi:unnamed protein product [Symbiodinium microadriaticum]|nr:unnamed protein product [Symbiodinium microadriaticum]